MPPFIYVAKQSRAIFMADDQLLDLLESMGQHGRNRNSPSTIKDAFMVAARRGLITPAEAHAGIKQVLRIPVKFTGA